MPSMRMPRRRGWVTALLTVLAVLLFALERLIVDDLRALGRWLARRDWVARAEAWVGACRRIRPCCAFALPGLAILPVKLLAVALLSQGHVLAGWGCCWRPRRQARWRSRGFYHAAEPALLSLAWFARVRATLLHWRKVVYDSVRQQYAWRLACVQWRPGGVGCAAGASREASAGDGAGRPSVAGCVSLTAEQNPESPPTNCAPALNR